MNSSTETQPLHETPVLEPDAQPVDLEMADTTMEIETEHDRDGIVLSKLSADDEPVRGVSGDYFVPLGAIAAWSRTSTGIRAEADDAEILVDILDADVFRLRVRRAGAGAPPPTYAVVRDPSTWNSDFNLVEEPSRVILKTNCAQIVVELKPFAVHAIRPDGSVIFQRGPELSCYARLNDEFVVARERLAGTAVLGLGQKTGRLDRSGRCLTLWNTDVLNPRTLKEFATGFKPEDPRADPRSNVFDPYYISIPFYQILDCEGRAAGFFIDNLHRADYDFSHPGETRIRFAGGEYDEYIFAGPDIECVTERYTELTGRMSPPPIWALGYHHCRWHPYSQADVLKIAETYRRKSIPCDSIWLDIDHMDGYRVFTWNKRLFPEPQSLLGKLKSLGFRSVTIVDPGVKVEPGYPVYDSGLKIGAFCKTEGGSTYIGQVWPGRTAFPDFASSAARDWWGDLNAKHIQNGLSGIWNDMNEPATGDIPDVAMRFDGGKYSHGAYHNGYATMMAMGTYQGLRKALPEMRPFILSRAGSAGIQRYAANWLGDNMSRWDHLALSIPMSLGLGLSGHAFVGADIGGFGENCEPELLIRWFQAACLSPFCRNHNDAGGIDQYPWSFGPEVETACKAAIELRYRLMPYLYTAFIAASETGRPMMRPLLSHDPTDPLLRAVDDQYLFGSDLLVAPIVEKGARTKTVVLPKGEWIDWYTGRTASSRKLEVDAPLGQVPIFARAGAIVPMWPEAPASTMGYQPETIELHVFVPSGDGRFTSTLVEDDGSSYAYENGQRLRTTFTVTRDGNLLRISAETVGRPFEGFRRSGWRICLHGATDPLVFEAPAGDLDWSHRIAR